MWILVWWVCATGCATGQGTMASAETCWAAVEDMEKHTALQAHCIYTGEPK